MRALLLESIFGTMDVAEAASPGVPTNAVPQQDMGLPTAQNIDNRAMMTLRCISQFVLGRLMGTKKKRIKLIRGSQKKQKKTALNQTRGDESSDNRKHPQMGFNKKILAVI